MAGKKLTPAEKIRAKELHQEGLSAREAGRRMGLTRGSMMGHWSRMGLNNAARGLKVRVVVAAKKQAPAPAKVNPAVKAAEHQAERFSRVPVLKYLGEAGAPLREVGPYQGGCKWPTKDLPEGGYLWCEAPRLDGRPYCGKHCRRAYVLVPKKEVKVRA